MNTLRTPDDRFVDLLEFPFAPHVTIEGGGHFLQQDRGEQLAALIEEFVRANP